jgi:hypothetical protein
MDLTRSHYHNGLLFTYDASKRQILPALVQYVNPSPYDINAGLSTRVGGLIPDVNFQTTFLRAFFLAYDDIQKNGSPLQFDERRHAGFSGEGFINGDLTFFVERKDKSGDSGYEAEFRATLAVNQFDGTLLSLANYIKGELATLVAKP